MLQSSLAFWRQGLGRQRLPEVLLSPKAVQNLVLALHELCTNARKPLGVPEGSVEVTWKISADGPLLLHWEERYGPLVNAPARKGFGRMVAEQAIESVLDAGGSTDFATEGLRWSLKLPRTQCSLIGARTD